MQQWRSYESRAKPAITSVFLFVTSFRPSFNGFRPTRNARHVHNNSQAPLVNATPSTPRSGTFHKVKPRRSRIPQSKTVIDAFQSTGHDIAIPRELPKRKIDLSTTPLGQLFRPILKVQPDVDQIKSEEAVLTGRGERVSLSAILARYLRAQGRRPGNSEEQEAAGLDADESILKDVVVPDVLDLELRISPADWEHGRPVGSAGNLVLGFEEEAYLQRKGYSLEDVEQWAGLLCEQDSDIAARKMLAHQRSDVGQSLRKPLPTFVFLLFLRRQQLSPAALRYCLIMASQEVRRKHEYSGDVDLSASATTGGLAEAPVLDDSSFFILILRLLRHARLNWPETLVMITAMFMRFHAVDKSTTLHNEHTTAQKHARLSLKYNQVLSLLALPVSQHPFSSMIHQQRAQFDLLKDMAEHRPALNLSRHGYQAIVDVQLANKKTDQERDWDNLKTKSWPPWKQERTGLDAEKDRNYGASRAMHVINRARDAGYGAERWEVVAGVLAGWNVDESPTIQTRGFALSRTSTVPTTARSSTAADHLSNPALWTARIKATRTVQEAWACFLTYKDQGLPATPDVYIAMLAKVASEDKRVARLKSPRRKTKPFLLVSAGSLNAGDTPEVMAPSTSPKEATYLRSPVPTVEKLVTEMFLFGLRPSGHQLILLLKSCTSLQQGLDWLRKSDPSSYTILMDPTPEHTLALNDVPYSVLFAFITLLCRFPLPLWQLDETPVVFAQRLLRVRKYTTRPAWHTLLTTIGHANVSLRLRSIYSARNPARFDHYTLVQQVSSEMTNGSLTPDTETLRIMCTGIEPAILDAQDILAARRAETDAEPIIRAYISPLDPPPAHVPPPKGDLRPAISLLGSGPHYISSIFNTVFGVGSRKPTNDVLKLAEMYNLPRLLAAPDFAALHAYVRVLGAMSDWQGLFNLVTWMIKYKDEIERAVDMPRNGRVLLRRTLVAIRVYLERTWVEGKAKRVDELPAPKHTIKIIRNMLKGIDDGWPEDRECEDYCRFGSFPGKRLVRQERTK